MFFHRPRTVATNTNLHPQVVINVFHRLRTVATAISFHPCSRHVGLNCPSIALHSFFTYHSSLCTDARSSTIVSFKLRLFGPLTNVTEGWTVSVGGAERIVLPCQLLLFWAESQRGKKAFVYVSQWGEAGSAWLFVW